MMMNIIPVIMFVVCWTWANIRSVFFRECMAVDISHDKIIIGMAAEKANTIGIIHPQTVEADRGINIAK